jgi:hypothetical protein
MELVPPVDAGSGALGTSDEVWEVDHKMGPCPGPLLVVCIMVPVGVVTMIKLESCESVEHSMRYPTGKKVLKPWMSDGCPLKRKDTRLMTPGVSILGQKQVRMWMWHFFCQSSHKRSLPSCISNPNIKI